MADMLRTAFKESKVISDKKASPALPGTPTRDVRNPSGDNKQNSWAKMEVADFDIRKTVWGLSERAKELDHEKRNFDKLKQDLVKATRSAI